MKIILFILLMFFKSLLFSQFFTNTSVYFNGKIYTSQKRKISMIESPNGEYWCRYKVTEVTDEVRILEDFEFYNNNQMLFSLNKAPGSGIYISNSGNIIFIDHTFFFNGKAEIYFFDRFGDNLFSKTFSSCRLFGFSEKGDIFGIGTTEKTYFFSFKTNEITEYEKAYQFAISEDETYIAIATKDSIKIFKDDQLLREIENNSEFIRKIKISSDYVVAYIFKNILIAYDYSLNKPIFTDRLSGNFSFRDLMIVDNQIITGIHYKDQNISKGILRIYNFEGDIIFENVESTQNIETHPYKSRGWNFDYAPIPWPFSPFDSLCTVWNYYEQHMGGYGPDWSYLHQGLDIITPIAENTFAVQAGVVKLVLTLGGAEYWRVAISPTQVSGYSSGYLYAHLIESSIQVDIGDTVQLHEYLGDIIQWYDDWGHIHFVEIRDSGLIWYYDDDEWGINFNPLLALQPATDTYPPTFENVFPTSKFGYAVNQSNSYLTKDSLYGEIDIIIKVHDYVGDTPWQTPAYITYYWITDSTRQDTVFQKTLGQILNHKYNFYSSGNYEPYATLLYKRDSLLIPSYWMDQERNYYQILTNNNGDSIAELSEKQLAFNTADYYDGYYYIFVEARDAYGNSTIDSSLVFFANNNSGLEEETTDSNILYYLDLNRNLINFKYSLNYNQQVKIILYDILGREIQTLTNKYQHAGEYSESYHINITNGSYFYTISLGTSTSTGKFIIIK